MYFTVVRSTISKIVKRLTHAKRSVKNSKSNSNSNNHTTNGQGRAWAAFLIFAPGGTLPHNATGYIITVLKLFIIIRSFSCYYWTTFHHLCTYFSRLTHFL